MKKLVTVIWSLMLTYPVFASLVPLSNDSYTDFRVTKELWVCTSVAFPIDIAYDVFNVDFKAIVQGGHGYFVQVHPGMHTDGSNMPTREETIKDHVQGVLNVAGKPAGVYEYVFISTDDAGFCGMSKDEQAVIRVYLVPQLTSFPVLTNICPGGNAFINFNDFIPPEIKYFIDEMGWSISWFHNDGTPITTTQIDVSLRNIGNTTYKYAISDNGNFAEEYAKLKSSIYTCPNDTAYLTHTVRVREGGEYAIPNKTISFCTDVLRLEMGNYSEPSIFTTNLFGYLGSSMLDGKWDTDLAYSGGQDIAMTEAVTIDENSGKVSIDMIYLKYLQVDSIVFKYLYKDCMAKDTFTLLSFNFNKNSFTNTFAGGNTQDVCRNLMSGVIELSSIFGFTVPLTSGIWYGPLSDPSEEVSYSNEIPYYGTVDISDKKAGSLYYYRYNVNEAVDSLCMQQGVSTLFQLRVLDLDAPSNAEMKICKSQFTTGVTVNLTRYVPGLDNIGENTITWRDYNGDPISDPANTLVKLPENSQIDEFPPMRYSYEVKSTCGPYSGNLYISTIDSIDSSSDTARRIVICYTDNYASHVDLFQIMGIAGASGSFEICSEQTIPSDAINSGIVDVRRLFQPDPAIEPAKDREIYTFCYRDSGANDVCMKGKNMEITVVVTKNVGDRGDSEFEKVVE
jgi:hypothetical protein